MQVTFATPATVCAIFMPMQAAWPGTGDESAPRPPFCLGPLVDTKCNMLYHCGDGEVSLGSRNRMDETHVERRLAAILVADIAGYSRLMAEDEAPPVATL